MNRAEEDYIKIVYELTVERGEQLVRTNELALRFGFSDQTVNEMVKRLAHKKIFKFSPYKGVSLTEEGRKEAMRMVRAHRIWEVFLTEYLGFNWSEVHDDAEQLEHATSQKVIDALYVHLGSPKYCQHGNPIPNKEGHVSQVSQINIFSLEVGQKFRLTRVKDNKDLLKYLDKIKINLADEFVVISKDEFVGLIEIQNVDKIILTKTIAEMLFVEKNRSL